MSTRAPSSGCCLPGCSVVQLGLACGPFSTKTGVSLTPWLLLSRATLSHWENMPVVDLAMDLGEMCPCSGHRGVALLLRPAWEHPCVTREAPQSCVHWPRAHMYRGGGCQGACVWASGGWQLPGPWPSCPPPSPSPVPAQTCSQGSDVGPWPRGSSRRFCPPPVPTPGLLGRGVGQMEGCRPLPGSRLAAAGGWDVGTRMRFSLAYGREQASAGSSASTTRAPGVLFPR